MGVTRLMFLPNQVVFIQFHPVTYIVKLNIEMAMANMIRKLARTMNNEPESGSGGTHRYGYGAESFGLGRGRGHNQDHELQTYTRTIDNKGPRLASDAASDDSAFVSGIQKTTHYNVTVDDAPNAARKLPPVQRSEDEISLANHAGRPYAV
ncbi:hypothetical protein PG985_005694 [Apiospora marii]|uniref:uncharacterized protein n=1 Tax=Apiospora marii TaxID=335849 RepID=UPI00312E0957